MKHFLFTIVGKPTGAGYEKKQLRLYVIKRGVPVFLTRYNYHCEDDTQACLNAVEQAKALPRKVLEAQHPTGGRDYNVVYAHCTTHNLSHTTIEKP